MLIAAESLRRGCTAMPGFERDLSQAPSPSEATATLGWWDLEGEIIPVGQISMFRGSWAFVGRLGNGRKHLDRGKAEGRGRKFGCLDKRERWEHDAGQQGIATGKRGQLLYLSALVHRVPLVFDIIVGATFQVSRHQRPPGVERFQE